MESLTGGLFSETFTRIPGASKAFRGAIVSYQDDVKKNFGVKEDTLDAFGAISMECAKEMAIKASYHFASDVAISFTGNAGPDAAEDKPVGMVFIAIKIDSTLYGYELALSGDRDEIRRQCVDFAFEQLCFLLND